MSATTGADATLLPLSKRFPPTATLVIARDCADGVARRATVHKEHLAFVETHLDVLALAGPYLNEASEHVIGSVFIWRSTDLARVRAWAESDPYFRAGVYASVEYYPHLPAAGSFVGGKIW